MVMNLSIDTRRNERERELDFPAGYHHLLAGVFTKHTHAMAILSFIFVFKFPPFGVSHPSIV
jgi:hypothetical protein